MEAEAAARHWEKLAEEQATGVGSTAAHAARRRLYLRTAESIRLGEKHGEPYCACHLRPVREMRAQDARRGEV